MGFNFRKRIKIIPGININITSKGISSVSVGGKVARVSIGKNGAKAISSIPGTGILYSQNLGARNKSSAPAPIDKMVQIPPQQLVISANYLPIKKIGFLHALGIFIFPYIFAWPLLQAGYSKKARYVSFGWLILIVFATISGQEN